MVHLGLVKNKSDDKAVSNSPQNDSVIKYSQTYQDCV